MRRKEVDLESTGTSKADTKGHLRREGATDLEWKWIWYRKLTEQAIFFMLYASTAEEIEPEVEEIEKRDEQHSKTQTKKERRHNVRKA